MSFDIDDIVTMDTGKEYYLIDKNIIDGITYFYAVEYIDDMDKLIDSEYCFFMVEDNEYLVLVDDDDIITRLSTLFIDKAKELIL